jgi:hypothetical protein
MTSWLSHPRHDTSARMRSRHLLTITNSVRALSHLNFLAGSQETEIF